MKSQTRLTIILSTIILISLFILYSTSSSSPTELEDINTSSLSKTSKNEKEEEESTTTKATKSSSKLIKKKQQQQHKVMMIQTHINYQQPFGSVTPAANAAPFLPKLNIRKLKPSSSSSPSDLLKVKDIACWDRLGNPQKYIPTWVSPLFHSIGSTATYIDMYNATEHEQWAALIGWVPTKFMGPQPPGVKANGQVMIPPTRGRDYKYYLKEYNASENWHAVFTEPNSNVGGVGGATASSLFGQSPSDPYVFQLGHKNAIAVCIRERIHISVRRCRPNSELPPILIHSCMCRKCDDRTVPATSRYFEKLSDSILHRNPEEVYSGGGNVGVKFLEYLFLPLIQLQSVPIQTLLQKEMKLIEIPVKNREWKKKLRMKQLMKTINSNINNDDDKTRKNNRACVPALSAPWLVSDSAVPRFDYEGKENDLDALLELQSDHRGHVIVVIFNSAWVDHLYNWIYSAVRNAHVTSFIVATMDDSSLTLCKQLRLPCYNAVEFAVFEDDPALKSSAHTRKVSEAMSWIKPRLASAIIGRGYGFWMIDLDMSWNMDPFTSMKQQQDNGPQLVHQCDAPARFSINSGFYDTRPTLMTYLFFNNMMTFTPDENSDQTAMRLFGRYDHSFALYNECLNKWVFDMKCNYKVPNSVKRVKDNNNKEKPMIETFEWNMMERDRSKFKWVVHHATCLSGAMAKILYLRTMNAWFLDDLEEWSNNNNNSDKNEWCWILPPFSSSSSNENDEMIKKVTEMGRIRFSPKYPGQGKTDEQFLQRRH
jgi:hypothetical protein